MLAIIGVTICIIYKQEIMKNKHSIIVLVVSFIFMLYACDDNFLEKLPEDEITVEAFFKSDQDFRTYSLGLYNWVGFGTGNDYNIPYDSDELVRGNQVQDDRIFDRVVVPASGGSWSWGTLRTINIMIREAQEADLDIEIKNHWEGVGRLFRAREYFLKVKLYGDVPWIDKELNDDSPELYATQDSRETVMAHVLEDLNFAIQNIRQDDGDNLINRDVALAIKSEICLFEGTFRKYHTELGLSDASMWLQECVSASEALMNGGRYTLSADYKSMYSSVDLSGNSEVILFKPYDLGVIVNIRARQLGIDDGSGVTKDAVETYLCSDGLPYGVSPLHQNAVDGIPELPMEEFENRDPRMSRTLVVPYNDPENAQKPTLFESDLGTIPEYAPAYIGEDGLTNPTGYGIYKWWTPDTPVDDVNGTTDAPLYAYNVILLNYAEAKVELGEANNEVLDKSINLLRDRVGMPHLTVEFADSFNDPKKAMFAPEISNLLWEVRRERRVELMLEESRFDDIVRWKKASYLGKPFVGAYVDLDSRPAAAYNGDGSNKAEVILGDRNGNPLSSDARRGYVLPYIERQPLWDDNDIKLYYTPIDTKSLTINPNLNQAPGW